MFWVWDGNGVDNPLMIWVVAKLSRPFPLLVPPHQQVGWERAGSWEGKRVQDG